MIIVVDQMHWSVVLVVNRKLVTLELSRDHALYPVSAAQGSRQTDNFDIESR